MSTAIQNIERQRGRREERKVLMAKVRTLIKLYGKDAVLEVLLAELKERHAND